MKINKPAYPVLFQMLRHDIADTVDDMAARAHFDTWIKHCMALSAINAVNVQPVHVLGYHSAHISHWKPLVKQGWIGRMIDRVGAFKRFCGHGYEISDAWYLAGKFN